MSHLIKPPKVKTIIKGLDLSQKNVAQMVYALPEIPFTMQGQVEDAEGNAHTVDIDFYYKIDPKKITGDHSNAIQAHRDRLGAAQQMTERFARGQADKRGEVTMQDLPDKTMLMQLYDDLDRAVDKRVLDCAATDEFGKTQWNYVGPDGQRINLTQELLLSDQKLSERIHEAFNEWWNPTKASSPVDMKTKQESGTEGSTTRTLNQSSTDLRISSGAVTNPTSDSTQTNADTSLSSTNPSS